MVANGVVSEERNKIKLWHLRMGHMPISMLHHIKTEFSRDCTLDHICQICPAAKQVRGSFHYSQNKSTAPLELLHVDV